MKAVSIKGKELISIDELATPELEDGDILVRMRACGLCGSDLEKVYGQYGMSSAKLGHEPSGEIIDVGNSVKDFSPGDRVFIHHHVACYSCYYCLHGDYTMCNMYQKSNIQPCGLSQQIVVPKWNISRGGLLRLPNNISFDEASLIEPLACCIRSLNKCNLHKGDDMAIFGAGPAGMMHVALANLFGVGKIIVVDINNFRIDFAKKFCYNISTFKSLPDKEEDLTKKIKNSTDSRGVDISIVATGSTKALAQAFEATRKAGKVMLFGVPSKNSNISLNMNKLYSNEQSFLSCYAASEIETNQALKLIAEKRLDIKRLITHRFSIENADQAIKCAHEAKDAMKVIVTSN
jgi:L-iditol 2-dehydrogenase